MSTDNEALRLIIQEENRALREELSQDIRDVNESTRELQRVLKGSNGTPGLVTTVSVLAEKVDGLKAASTEKQAGLGQLRSDFTACRLASSKDIDQIKTDIAILRTSQEGRDTKDKVKDDKEESENKFGSWNWFRDKNIFPVLMAIATYLALEAFKLLATHLK